MQQVLFHIPILQSRFGPDGIPLYGFGAMLFVAFVVVVGWGMFRNARVGLPKEKTQDLAMVLFITGIAGARVLYMWQYSKKYPNKSPGELFLEFFQIWNGGIVFYGSVFGGMIGFLVYRHRVLKRLGVNGWKLADAVAPLMAVGMAAGRIGCYLNGCCWGQVACDECQPVPLSARLGKFPLLPAHARGQVVNFRTEEGDSEPTPHLRGLQTTTGFSIQDRPLLGDPRAVVRAVEPGSEAAAAGLKPGDRITGINGRPNQIVLTLGGPDGPVAEAVKRLVALGGVPQTAPDSLGFADPAAAAAARAKLADTPAVRVTADDELTEAINRWPRGRSELALDVDRGGTPVAVKFTPRTVGFFPTQLYETVSMLLLTLLLLAFQPFRRHDGQVMVLLMLGYSAHRFLNEALRIEPTYALGLTLSQWISVGIFAAGILMDVYLRQTQPKLPPGRVPLGYGATPAVG